MKSLMKEDCNLSSSRIDVWIIDLEKHAYSDGFYRQLLSSDEIQRAERFKVESKRNEFITARGCLRAILSSALNAAPKELQFSENEHGKPYLNAPCPSAEQIRFNVSHSHDFALIAVSLNRALGVDIEKIRNKIDYAPLAERFFHPVETQNIMDLPLEKRLGAFYSCWARKEALLKAVGKGISMGLGKFQVSVNSNTPPKLESVHWDCIQKNDWWISDLNIKSNYAAAIAAQGDRVEVHTRNLSPY